MHQLLNKKHPCQSEDIQRQRNKEIHNSGGKSELAKERAIQFFAEEDERAEDKRENSNTSNQQKTAVLKIRIRQNC